METKECSLGPKVTTKNLVLLQDPISARGHTINETSIAPLIMARASLSPI